TSWSERLYLRMSKEKRNLALIMDSVTCDSVNEIFRNLYIMFLSKNSTSSIQLCGLGIIKFFKDKYVRFMAESMIYNADNAKYIYKIIKKTSIFNAICITKLA
ncbi:hypothetical protein CDIK_4376, partial [Cucumispora dikerogammari]